MLRCSIHKISVVLNVLDATQLELCIRSLFEQRYFPSRIILIGEKEVLELSGQVLRRLKEEISLGNVRIQYLKAKQSTDKEIIKSLGRFAKDELAIYINEYCVLPQNWIRDICWAVEETKARVFYGKLIKNGSSFLKNGLVGTAFVGNYLPRAREKAALPIYYVVPQKKFNKLIRFPLWYVKTGAKNPDPPWTVLVIDPFAIPLTWVVANFTLFSPNFVTFLSFVVSLVSAWFFFQGGHTAVVMGGILYEFSFLLDCVDGKLARIKKTTSPIGKFADSIKDRFSLLINLLALGFGQYKITQDSNYVLLGLLYSFLDTYKRLFPVYYRESLRTLELLRGDILRARGYKKAAQDLKWSFQPLEMYKDIKNKLAAYRIIIKPVDVELEALVFLFGPIFYQIKPVLIFAIIYQLFFLIVMNFIRGIRLQRLENLGG